MSEQALFLPIGAVERETRVSKELLRMWERRYGFPAPARDEAGDRIYSSDEVDKLKLIRQLIDRGFRPGRLMSMPTATLRELQSGSARQPLPQPLGGLGEGETVLGLLRQRNCAALLRWFSHRISEQGLRSFVSQTMVEVNEAVGLAWQQGRLAVHEEHLYAEQAQAALRQAMQPLYPACLAPRVMLTTVPGETHRLGLAMVEVMLRLEQCDLLSFGTELPLGEISEAAVAHRVDIVALSFSSAYGEANARRMLSALAAQLPPGIVVWAGGSGVRHDDDLPGSVRVLSDLTLLSVAVGAWRSAHV